MTSPVAQQDPNPVLIFGYGNPSRGDDALGPLLLERLQARPLPGPPSLLTDFQLQIEHALDLTGRQRVLFVDASADAPAPFRYGPLQPALDPSFTTHALTPAALLHVYGQLGQGPPPPCRMLAIRGYRFDLGAPLSPAAERNLARAVTYVESLLLRWQGRAHHLPAEG